MEEAGLRRVRLFRQRPEKRGASGRAETEAVDRVTISSCAGLTRASIFFARILKEMDGRVKPGHDGKWLLQSVILCTERGPVAGIAAGHADMNLVALANR